MAAKLILETDQIEVANPPVLAYGQPGCIAGDVRIAYAIRKHGKNQNSKGGTMELLYRRFHGLHRPGRGYYQRPQTIGSYFFVQSVNNQGRVFMNRIVDVLDSGMRQVFNVVTSGGKSVRATANHEFMVEGNSYQPLGGLRIGDAVFVNPGRPRATGRQRKPHRAELMVKNHPANRIKIIDGKYAYCRVRVACAVYEAEQNGMSYEEYVKALNTWPREKISTLWSVPPGHDIHHLDHDISNNVVGNLLMETKAEHQRKHHVATALERIGIYVEADTILSIDPVGVRRTYDICCEGPYHNFIADGIAVHNSGKTSLAQTANKPLTLDFDNGTHRSAFRKAVMRMESWEDVVEEQKKGTFAPFETVVVDTVGTCLELMAQTIIAGNAKLGTRAGGLTMQGWGVLKTTFGAWLSSLKAAGKQVILIAHQKEEKDGDVRMLRPDIAGGSYAIVMNSSDIVGYLSYRNNQRFISWEPTDQYFAKNGAQLKAGPIPDFATSPRFMAELLATAKGNLGKTSQASAEIARLVEDWKAKLSVAQSASDLNMAVNEVAKLDLRGTIQAQVWALFQARAKEINCVFDKKAKAFHPVPQAPAAPAREPGVEAEGAVA